MRSLKTPIRASLKTGAATFGLATAIIATGAFAQDETALADPSARGGIADIIVTAQRYEQSLQDTPLSVVALNGDQLAAAGVDSLDKFDTFIPNVSIGGTMAQGNAIASFAIRGIGGAPSGFVTQEGSVGVYVDDILFARPNGALLDLLDVERVEVLRGPQGTLFGRNTAGGAIRYVTKRPDFAAVSGNVRAAIGSYQRRDLSANLNLPLADTLAVRFSASQKNQDGYVTRIIDGDRLGDRNSTVMRVQARWQPTPRLDIELSADTIRTHDDGSPTVIARYEPTDLYPTALYCVAVSPTCSASNVTRGAQARALAPAGASPSGYTNAAADLAYFLGQAGGRYEVYGGLVPDTNRFKSYGLAGTIAYELSDTVTAKSLTGYRDLDQTQNQDFDRSPLPLYGLNERIGIEYFTQEFQFTGQSFADRLKWVVGAFYYWDKAEDYRRRLGSGSNSNSAYADDGSLFVNPADGIGLGELEQKFITTKSIALFGQGSFSITDGLVATLGLRWNRDTKEYTAFREGRGRIGGVAMAHTVKDSWSNLSPRFGLEYHWNDDVMTYVSAAKGFKGGGFNDTVETNCVDPQVCGLSSFAPENLWTYEVGLRSDLFDRKLRFNITGFYTDYKDQQIQYIDSAPPPTQFTVNGDATVKGVEVELMAAPIGGLLLRASGGYVHTRYNDDILGINSGIVQIARTTPYFRSPKWSYSLGASYSVPVSDAGEASFDLNWGWKDSQASTASPTNMVMLPSYGLLNGRIEYRSKAGWSIALTGNNLLDKYYLTGGFDPAGPASLDSPGLGAGRHDAVFGFEMLDLGRPREVGLELNYRF